MSRELLFILSAGWPVLLCAGLLLGVITLRAAGQPRHLLWFLPVLLFTAIAFVLFTGRPVSTPLLAAEQLGIGVVAVAPAVALSFAAAWCVLHYRAPGWLLVAAPATTCLVSTPLVGYIALVAVCELTGDCL